MTIHIGAEKKHASLVLYGASFFAYRKAGYRIIGGHWFDVNNVAWRMK